MAFACYTQDDDYIVYVNALDGEILGGSMSLSVSDEAAGCFGQSNNNYLSGETTTKLAAEGMEELGYDVTTYISDTSTLETKVQDFIDNDDSYGFYVRAHGSSNSTDPYLATKKATSSTTTTQYDIFYSSDISGNWHFVFLDACYTGRTIWAESFNITNSKSNVAYLGWNGKVYTSKSALFGDAFWPLVGTMSIRNAAVAAAEVPGSGTTPIRFYGDSSYDGSAW